MRDGDPIRFEVAPWSVSLFVSSALATALVLVVSLAALRVVPFPPGFTRDFGFGVALLPVACLAGACLFTVTGYTITPTALGIRRLLWTTTIPVSGPVGAAVDPGVCKGSFRLFGNAGLFAFSGWFSNRRLGRFRMFATNFDYAVVLKIGSRTIVVTPGSPENFVQAVRTMFPGFSG